MDSNMEICPNCGGNIGLTVPLDGSEVKAECDKCHIKIIGNTIGDVLKILTGKRN